MNPELSTIIADELSISKKSVAATLKLLDEGCTIPFISRYRKEATGALDEVAKARRQSPVSTIRAARRVSASLSWRAERMLKMAAKAQ